MGTPPLTREQCEAAVEAAASYRTLEEAAQSLGLSRGALANQLHAAARYGLPNPRRIPRPGFNVVQESAQLDADGNLQKQWLKTAPEREPASIPPGHAIKGVSQLLDAGGNVVQQWIKTREDRGLGDLIAGLRAAFAEYAGKAEPVAAPTTADSDLLTVYVIADAHLGLHAWGRETGSDWDLKIATQTLDACLGELVEQSRPTHKAIVLKLGDTTHQNDQTNKTPRSGHQLDVDGRWPKVLRAAADLSVGSVRHALRRHKEVLWRAIPGNHDPDAATALTVALSLFFSSEKRVVVDDSPSPHFYHRFGKVLIGATHGHLLKPPAMAMMLAADRPADWGQSEHRHFFFGHIHHESAKEIGAVRVESFNSPAARDAYAHGGGWRAGRSLVAITFHRERGEIGRHRVNIAPPKAA